MFTALLTLTLVNAGNPFMPNTSTAPLGDMFFGSDPAAQTDKPEVSDYKLGNVVKLHSLKSEQWNNCRARVLERNGRKKLKPGRVPVRVFDISDSEPFTKDGTTRKAISDRVLALKPENLEIMKTRKDSCQRHEPKATPWAQPKATAEPKPWAQPNPEPEPWAQPNPEPKFTQGELVWIRGLKTTKYNDCHAIVQELRPNGRWEVLVFFKEWTDWTTYKQQKIAVRPENMFRNAPLIALKKGTFVRDNGCEGVVLAFQNNRVLVGFPRDRNKRKFEWGQNIWCNEALKDWNPFSYEPSFDTENYTYQWYNNHSLLEKIFFPTNTYFSRRRLNSTERPSAN